MKLKIAFIDWVQSFKQSLLSLIRANYPIYSFNFAIAVYSLPHYVNLMVTILKFSWN